MSPSFLCIGVEIKAPIDPIGLKYAKPKPVAKTPVSTKPKKPMSYGGLGGFSGKRGGGRSFLK